MATITILKPNKPSYDVNSHVAKERQRHHFYDVFLFELNSHFGPLLTCSYPEGTTFRRHIAPWGVKTIEDYGTKLEEPTLLAIGRNVSIFFPKTAPLTKSLFSDKGIYGQWTPFFDRDTHAVTPAEKLIFLGGSRADMEYGLDLETIGDTKKVTSRLNKIADQLRITFPVSANGTVYQAHKKPHQLAA